MPISVGTDHGLALATRKGTGYYKVPSLKGVETRAIKVTCSASDSHLTSVPD